MAAEFEGRFAVSTHSRLKAAGKHILITQQQELGFNTQPPEGGWEFNVL